MSDLIAVVVERFRDAALGISDWPSALEALAAASGSHMVQLTGVTTNAQLVLNHTHGISTDQMDAYSAREARTPG